MAETLAMRISTNKRTQREIHKTCPYRTPYVCTEQLHDMSTQKGREGLQTHSGEYPLCYPDSVLGKDKKKITEELQLKGDKQGIP